LPSNIKKPNGPSPARVVRSLIIVVVLAVLLGVLAKLLMNTLNRTMGIDSEANSAATDSTLSAEAQETVQMPELEPVVVIDTGSSVWVPDWKLTPCSLFVTAESDAVIDSLPESPETATRNTELQLLVEMWAEHSGFSTAELDRTWAFASGDTCFVDLPRSADWYGIVRTIEGRFVSYTLMYPFIAGENIEGFEDGIPVRGVSPIR
jgi:hypothetical protein